MTMLKRGDKNKKLNATQQINRVHIATFSIPAVKTCPGAKACLVGGYCTRGNYGTSSIKAICEDNLKRSMSGSFVDDICHELDTELWDVQYVRIHPVGDFYDMDYFLKWVAIADKKPSVVFYAYTKSVNIVKKYLSEYELPRNMVISYSYGGKYDDMINPDKDYHTIVIGPNDEIPAGYVDCGDDDLMMVNGYKKIAIRYHDGHNGKTWGKSGFSQVILPQ